MYRLRAFGQFGSISRLAAIRVEFHIAQASKTKFENFWKNKSAKMGKDDPETAALKKELNDLVAKLKVNSTLKLI